MSKRLLFSFLVATVLHISPVLADPSDSKEVEVWKSPTCGCCKGWMGHMNRAGFAVKEKNVEIDVLLKIKKQAGITPDFRSCHTAKIGGYVIEGHVPAEDIKRLLHDKPDATGLVVPGMPLGSPGMDYGKEKERYEVLLLKKDGSTEVFARH